MDDNASVLFVRPHPWCYAAGGVVVDLALILRTEKLSPGKIGANSSSRMPEWIWLPCPREMNIFLLWVPNAPAALDHSRSASFDSQIILSCLQLSQLVSMNYRSC